MEPIELRDDAAALLAEDADLRAAFGGGLRPALTALRDARHNAVRSPSRSNERASHYLFAQLDAYNFQTCEHPDNSCRPRFSAVRPFAMRLNEGQLLENRLDP